MLKYLAIATVLLAVPVAAQVPSEEAKACVPNGDRFEAPEKEWPREAERYKPMAPNVSRRGDKLRLALDGGHSLELQDCPYGDTGHQYLYERYDDAGGFYVIRKSGYEDLTYTLVMKRTGRLIQMFGTPVWANDKSRFLTVACSALSDRGMISIYSPKGDGLALDAEFKLPCNLESCSARWDFQSWISVICTPIDDPGKKGTEFVLLRASDNTWKNMGR
jgi:hypothetical protein